MGTHAKQGTDSRPRRLPALLGLGLVIAVGSIAGVSYASVASSTSPVVHACYLQATGLTRIVAAGTACRQGETAISWNQTGPRGPAGPTGSTGPRGPAGVANAYAGAPGTSTAAFGTDPVDVASVTVPAGSYTLTASVELFNFTPDYRSGSCLLTDSTHVLSLGGNAATLLAGEAVPLGATGIATVPTATTFVLACSGAGMSASGGRIVAVQVGALHAG